METITEFLIDWGYWGLFLSALIAGSVLPFSSEAVMVVLAGMGLDPVGCVVAAALGNTLGGMTCYWIGTLGKTEWITRLGAVQLLGQLCAVLIRTADGEQRVRQAADHPLCRAVVVLFPLVGHKTDQLVHHGIALPGAHPVLIVQRHQRQRSTAVGIRPLIQPGAELRFKIAAVEHTGQEIVIHIVPAELPLPRGHPILRHEIAVIG